MPEVVLSGCTPVPLMNYLKALGVLRLVTEQKDQEARGRWREDEFVLQSGLDGDALLEFLANSYQPTPILAPWNGGSGFYRNWDPATERFRGGDVIETLQKIADSKSNRLESYRKALKSTLAALARLGNPIDLGAEKERIHGKAKREGWSAKKYKAEIRKFLNSLLLFEVNGQTVCLEKRDKGKFLRRLRGDVLSDEALGWLDAGLILQSAGPAFAPLLGTGGNDGRLDFSQSFMGRLIELDFDAPQPSKSSRDWLENTLFGVAIKGMSASAVGQFAPGRAGGPNATQGMEGDAIDNPWDFVLMVEGAVTLGGAAVRRFAADTDSRAAFPFTVLPAAVAYTSASGADLEDARGELWLPLWERPATLAELTALLGEGRAEVSGRPARDGVDFARAVASLGVDRGIKQFARFSFLKRSGKAYLAAPLGRLVVRQQQSVDLIRQIDPWLNRFREASAHKDAPPRFKAALRDVEQAIFEFCRYGEPGFFQGFFQAILVALGQAERELAVNEGRVTNKQSCNPLPPLSSDWIDAANDRTPEFELALALAGVFDLEQKIGSLRTNLEPVALQRRKDGKRSASWAEKGRSVVWNSASLPANLAQVLARRIMDGERAGCKQLPLAARNFVSLSTVSQFLAGELDDRRIEELLWGLVLVDQERRPDKPSPPSGGSGPLPRAYALLKLLFLPEPLKVGDQEILIKPEPRVLALLSAGRVGEARQIAMRRLRASGLSPLPHPRSGGVVRDGDWKELDCLGADGQRLAAALLMPISKASIHELQRLVTRNPANEESE
jgi:CRISPR-associated protein Csx17